MRLITIPPKKTSKYKNVKCIVNNITFASIKEGKRYIILYYMEKAGEISSLRTQVPFPVVIDGTKICVYKADFVYFDKHGRQVVEDTKGMKTDVYKLKKKLLRATTGITIIET